MRLSDAEFVALLEKVEEQGGQLSGDKCPVRVYNEWTGDTSVTAYKGGCNTESLFDIMYEPDNTVIVPTPVMIRDPRNPKRQVTKTEPRTADNGDTVQEPVTVNTEHRGLRKDDFPQILTVCAYEDNVADWPRFKDAA